MSEYFKVRVEQISKKEREEITSYTFVAHVFQNDGEEVERTEFFGAEVHTDEVRVLTGSGLRIAMLQGNAVSASASTPVTGDMIDAFAEMQEVAVVSKDGPMAGVLEV